MLSTSPVWTDIQTNGAGTSLTNISDALQCLYAGGRGFTQKVLAAVTEENVSELDRLDWTGERGTSVRHLLNLKKVILDPLGRVLGPDTTWTCTESLEIIVKIHTFGD